ncbi:hypothetical protein B0H67DRAFT_496358 [Lasiosphaeris hirsuta]|uniref:FAD-binding PCMH-type domain-containing protein n=1 Tax=Lasiosphaeris hirsuta TaxID=260670 RepID=A0AA40DKQ2_9PEZI|nr:hypothetical protein B0H67DRAFT_496358 [Lasiosphaeris hirsuta]
MIPLVAFLALTGTSLALPPSLFINSTLTLLECLTTNAIPYVTLLSPNWAEYATTFNARLEYTPAAITLPTTPLHISQSILCASRARIPVQPKSGGHSYASYSTGGRNGILQINLENFNSVTVDNATGIAKVGGGVRLGNLALGIWEQGRRALGHGTCPGVGVGGHFTHGGYGYSSRAFGLGLDQIVGLEVVLADGRVVYADERKNSDVYYAMRGAADAFGVVVNFYLQTSPAPPQVVQWSFSFPQALSSVSAAVGTFRGVQMFALDGTVVDRNLGFGVTISNNATVFTVHGTYFGSLTKFNSTIMPALLSRVPYTPASDSKSVVEEVDWITSLTLLGGAPTLEVPLHGYDQRDNFFAKSVTTSEPFPDEALRSYFGYILDKGVGVKAPVSWFAIINLYGGPDSQITTKTEGFAAYSGHDDFWVIQNLNGTFPSSGLTFLNGLNDAATVGVPEHGAYLNYVDPTYSRAEAYKLYYGEELYEKLVGLKKTLDPRNLFSNPQSIV